VISEKLFILAVDIITKKITNVIEKKEQLPAAKIMDDEKIDVVCESNIDDYSFVHYSAKN
jgi:hypothetical protein